MLVIRLVVLCPHSLIMQSNNQYFCWWYPRVVQSATCPVCELTSPRVV